MLVFLDFEASSLGKTSYPIEVGWVFEDGRSEAHLIRPAPDWTDWDHDAEAIHHIARSRLDSEGEPHEAVARRMVEALSGHDLRASAPSWDGKWLSTLLRAAGLPRHSLRLADSDEAIGAAPRAILAEHLPAGDVAAAVEAVLAKLDAAERSPAHRALADAEQERARWLAAREAAQALVAERTAG